MELFGGIDLSFFNKYSDSSRILDYGCGDGNFSKLFLNKGLNVVSVDMNPNSEFYIKKDLNDEQINRFKFYCLDAERESFPDYSNYFDYIVCREVLEHIKNYQKVLNEFHTLLRPGGILIISVPTSFSEKYFSFWDKKWFSKCRHVNIFKKREFKKILKNHKFEIIKTSGHSFRRVIFWSMVTPFRVNHDMGKFTKNSSFIKFANFCSNCICYFKFIEKIGDFLLPKSYTFYIKKI